tara:strand:- start:109 stop:495 length:387 start_codon:yes stop_codon:yes gene_type:complete
MIFKKRSKMRIKGFKVLDEIILSVPNIIKMLILSTGFLFIFSGCITLGKDFPAVNVSSIKIGQTTKSEVRKLFGPPWLSGNKDGELTWTYGNYDYSLFGERKAKDMVVQFDDKGVVTTYTYSTTEHSE